MTLPDTVFKPARKLRILFVEDWELQLFALTRTLEESGDWEVIICKTPAEARQKLDLMDHTGLPDIVSVDLGLADKPKSAEHGLELLKHIRKRWDGLALVVHSNLQDIDEQTVRDIVAQGASFCHLGDENSRQAYLHMLPLLARGYAMYSPLPARLLAAVAAPRPDPFAEHPIYWDALKLLPQQPAFSYEDIGRRLGVTEAAIKSYVGEIYNTLLQTEEISPAERTGNQFIRNTITKWYLENKHRAPR